jgi:integrase
MSYDALRKVLTRANADLGTNWTMHDLRPTCALRMSRDDKLSALPIHIAAKILGHKDINTLGRQRVGLCPQTGATASRRQARQHHDDAS